LQDFIAIILEEIMILFYGGAFQGKTEYAMSKHSLDMQDIYFCNGNAIDFSKKAINGLHIFIYEALKSKTDPEQYIRDNLAKFKDKIILCDDISCGVVPITALERKWRECVGRCMKLLSSESDSVIRIFCGLPQILK
jgi:adenosylcobinamide kinase/adenosylcobinamide-phosphate guanylyltransferase